jgi:hypothetical protein
MGTSHHRLTRHARAGLSAFIIALIGSLVALPFAAPAPVRAAGTIYVTPNGTGDGSSWANAASLQDALTTGGTVTATSGDDIWLAEGVYYPTLAADPNNVTPAEREITFQLVAGVNIYGGFAATGEPEWGDRDTDTNVTILSGDIGQDDTDDDGNNIAEDWNDIQGDNAYHVVVCADDATLDGLTITAGQAHGSFPNNNGGGMFNEQSSPTLTNVTFSGNQASDGDGGGMSNTVSIPELTDVTFSGNYANVSGGGMYNASSSSNPLNIRRIQS